MISAKQPAAKAANPPPDLFQPLSVGPWTLQHRIVMAPLGQLRARALDGAATAEMSKFYADRATPGGLIVAEASAVSLQGTGQRGMPGLYSSAQVNSWREAARAVRAAGGFIVAQLWHGGRLARASASGLPVVSASAIAARGPTYAPSLQSDQSEQPLELDEEGIETVVDQYRQAAENAADAGFDGVELHCANGCLVDQFLHDGVNRRLDAYGGSAERRVRFLVDTVQALASVWGSERVGVRLSPFGQINDVRDSDPQQLFRMVIEVLQAERIGYIHVMEPRAGGGLVEVRPDTVPEVGKLLRPWFSGVLIASGGFDAAEANMAVKGSVADAISFGRAFIANPDLPSRIANGRTLDQPDRRVFFCSRPV